MDLREIRRAALEKALGPEVYPKMVSFFSDLFIDGSEEELQSRRYIILTRKGFLLWVAATLSGLTGDRKLTSKQVISDRYWKKMTVEERHQFTRGKDVYLVDDTIVTGSSVNKLYSDLDPRVCASRRIRTLFCDNGFRKGILCEDFRREIDIGIIDRRERNAEILVALYKLAIPFTAESPTYSIYKVERSAIKAWKETTPENNVSGWFCEKEDDLDFGGAGQIAEAFLLNAPAFAQDDANILFRGMRVCYRELSEEEDPDQKYAELTLIPWLMFDIINYQTTIAFLENLIAEAGIEGGWIHNQIQVGETSRKRVVIHRVISYLMAECVKKEFERDILNPLQLTLSPYQVLGEDIETFHYHEPLLTEVRALSVAAQARVTDNRACYYADLAIGKDVHDQVARELLNTSWERLAVPHEFQSMEDLCDVLCEHRERKFDETTGYLDYPDSSKRFPILFYTGEKRGILALSYARRSIASFHSGLMSHHEVLYLVNTLVPGEGGAFAYLPSYPFIWGLHQVLQKGTYVKGMEKAFFAYWNKCDQVSSVKVSKVIVDLLSDISFSFWPSCKYILKRYPEGKREKIDCAIQIADDFYQNEWKAKIASADPDQ